jgi:hypothetical protein
MRDMLDRLTKAAVQTHTEEEGGDQNSRTQKSEDDRHGGTAKRERAEHREPG